MVQHGLSVDEMRGPVGIEMARAISLFKRLDLDKKLTLPTDSIHNELLKSKMSSKAEAGVRDLLSEASRNGRVDYKSLFDTFVKHGWQPEIQLFHGSVDPFEGKTSHRTDYVPHSLPPRAPPSNWQPAPHNHRLDSTTTSGDAYREWPLAPPQRRPVQEPAPSAPFEGSSSYKDDYRPHQLPPRAPPSNWQPAPHNHRLDSTTTSGDAYREWPLAPPQRRPVQEPAPSAPFEGSSSYKDDYRPHQLPPRAPPSNWQPAPHNHRLDSTTTSGDAYREWPLAPPQRRPVQEPAPSAPFEGSSSYKDDYRPHQLPPRAPPSNWQPAPHNHRLDSTTTSGDAYREWPLAPPQRRPVQEPAPSAPFEGSSSYKDDYRPHQLPPRAPPSNWQPAPHNHRLDSTTTSGDAYREWPLAPPQRRPVQEPAPSAPFEGSSSYKDDYRPHQLPPRAPPSNWQPAPHNHRLDSTTTSGDAYREWPLAPPQRRPVQEPAPSAPFEGSSSYKDDYRPHQLPPRAPPSNWQPAPHNHRLDSTTTHKDSYRPHEQLQLPPGHVPSIGVLFRSNRDNGVDYYELIPASSVLPARGTQIFTTVIDEQVAMVIRVVATVGRERLAIGTFELASRTGFYPLRPKVEVCLRLDEQMVLSVSAVDLSDGNRSQMIVHNVRLLNTEDQPSDGAFNAPEVTNAQCLPPSKDHLTPKEQPAISTREQRLAERQRNRGM
ncbi:hypothetical protein AB1Y20_012139 [Prymnesium parvum]|uniref:Uncharacterized protein n=1 Tax=Prymnesium parvum TaxID=97485 RepID=A0AB34IQ25_PRYPA